MHGISILNIQYYSLAKGYIMLYYMKKLYYKNYSHTTTFSTNTVKIALVLLHGILMLKVESKQ